jgi:hypothetical protein
MSKELQLTIARLLVWFMAVSAPDRPMAASPATTRPSEGPAEAGRQKAMADMARAMINIESRQIGLQIAFMNHLRPIAPGEKAWENPKYRSRSVAPTARSCWRRFLALEVERPWQKRRDGGQGGEIIKQ